MRKLGLITVLLTVGCGGGSPGDDDAIDAAGPDADPSAPTCTISAPDDGAETAFDVAVDLTATATDPEDGTLSGASVVWRTDLDTAPLGSGLALTTTLPVGDNVVTCTATDSDGKTGSDTITIASRSPYAQINHPGNNETRSIGDGDFPFSGVARDLEDGALTGASMVWTSNIDGELGTGESFDALPSQGVHTITLTATDDDANTHAVSITLTMNP
jgi:hypothetical protein